MPSDSEESWLESESESEATEQESKPKETKVNKKKKLEPKDGPVMKKRQKRAKKKIRFELGPIISQDKIDSAELGSNGIRVVFLDGTVKYFYGLAFERLGTCNRLNMTLRTFPELKNVEPPADLVQKYKGRHMFAKMVGVLNMTM